ncbi:coiled-coil domain-containing protein 113 isoform X2 [Phasianus colchicus]|uniref:coiled-coil domain-containing protein 113 isoform X2 n=1 Tax=Phasianus colchicus TaxID=9054 RepID=UPI00129D5BB3|nr:coiled-coil domain-containing protein 113 isoform X2 [Phasianus colchicus]
MRKRETRGRQQAEKQTKPIDGRWKLREPSCPPLPLLPPVPPLPGRAMAEQELAALPLPQLRDRLEQKRHANDLLRARVELFQNQYHKMQLSSAGVPQHGSPSELVPALTRGRSRSRLRSSSSAYFAALTVEQKCELAERELLDVKSDIQKMKEDSETTLHDLEAVIQEADAWWADVKKAVSDFEEGIVSTISNEKGSITASEKLLRYLEEKNHQRDLTRQKLRLESNFLRSYKKKLQQQLRQKEQVGDMLHEIHAELLQVKKAQYEEEIDEKNKELQQLKLALEKIQILNFWKKKLHNAMETSTVLMKDISQRKEMLEKVERNTAFVKEQHAKEERLIGWLQKQLSDYSTPPVMNYVQTMIAVADLEKSIKAWERKVAIAEMTLQSHHRAWNQVKMSGNLHLPCVMLQGKQWKPQGEPALWGNLLSNGGTSRFHPSLEKSQGSA